MAEWLYEAGIGEVRAALIDQGRIIKARIELEDGGARAGTVAEAKLINAADRIVALPDGEQALLAHLPPGVSEGATLTVEVVREALPEPGKRKRAKVVPAPGAALTPGPTLLERIGDARRLFPHESDALEAAGWTEMLDEAMSGHIAFAGGALHLALTPAMTIIDVDGTLPPETLAITAAGAVGAALERHNITGSVGIDFPTLGSRDARKAVDTALDASLHVPFERTAMNGFGFTQIVRRRVRASLMETLQGDPVGARVRAALRQMERDPQDRVLPVADYAYLMNRPHWVEELERRTGRRIKIEKEML